MYVVVGLATAIAIYFFAIARIGKVGVHEIRDGANQRSFANWLSRNSDDVLKRGPILRDVQARAPHQRWIERIHCGIKPFAELSVEIDWRARGTEVVLN